MIIWPIYQIIEIHDKPPATILFPVIKYILHLRVNELTHF